MVKIKDNSLSKILIIMINCVMRALSSGLSEGRSRSWASTRSIAGTVGHSGDTPENALLCFFSVFCVQCIYREPSRKCTAVLFSLLCSIAGTHPKMQSLYCSDLQCILLLYHVIVLIAK